MSALRDVTLDDVENLAVGAWILGTGGGGSPYLGLCARAGIAVTHYADEAEATMIEDAVKGGRFERVTLRPRVTIKAGDPDKARDLHHEAHRQCFIANSVNFPVDCEPTIALAE